MDIYPPTTKHCIKCNQLLSIDNFNKNKSTKDGYCSYCKECRCSYNKEYYKNRNTCVEKRTYKKKPKQSSDKWLEEYYQTKKDANAYRNAIVKRNRQQRETAVPLLTVIRITRSMVSSAFRSTGYKKNSYTHEIIGCSYEQLKQHIELQFTPGMSWDNHGEWHIDHIIPVSYGISVEEIIALNNYINLQPLWAKDNLRKGNRFLG